MNMEYICLFNSGNSNIIFPMSFDLNCFLNLQFSHQGSWQKNLIKLMNTLQIQGEKNNSTTSFGIEIKSIKNPMKALKIRFEWDEDKILKIRAMDGYYNCIVGIANEKSELKNIDATTNFSGNTLMLIWDKICSLLHCGRVELNDAAELSCKHCSQEQLGKGLHLKLWRIFGDMRNIQMNGSVKKINEYTVDCFQVHPLKEDTRLTGSWYEKFGYRIKAPSEEYWKVIEFLSSITLGELSEIYDDDVGIKQVLQRCFDFAADKQDSKDTFLFSAVIRKLDLCIKKDSIDQKVHELFHEVRTLFMTRLKYEDYRLFDEKEYSFDKEDKKTKKCFENCLKYVNYKFFFYKVYN